MERVEKMRFLNEGIFIEKGKRQLYINFKSVSDGERARLLIANNSFNKLFNFGKKIKSLGNNVSSIILTK